jgi:hypothetical protein
MALEELKKRWWHKYNRKTRAYAKYVLGMNVNWKKLNLDKPDDWRFHPQVDKFELCFNKGPVGKVELIMVSNSSIDHSVFPYKKN